MELKKQTEKKSFAIKITWNDNGQEVGRARLYVMFNDLHSEPFGFMEDVFVDEKFRGQGWGKKLVQAVIEEATIQKCYKLLCTARHTKPEVQTMYENLGFKNHGVEFRMDLNKV